MVVGGDVGRGLHEQVVAGHAAERRVNDGSDEDVSGGNNKVIALCFFPDSDLNKSGVFCSSMGSVPMY
jgi:hypothetical protein